MSAPRKFDHEECRRLYATGRWTLKALGTKYGVTDSAVWFAVNDRGRRMDALRKAESQSSGVCSDCGGRKSHNPYKKGALNLRCRACNAIHLATSVRDETLQCVSCREWKPDSEFAWNKRAPHRRDRHKQCRACNTLARRAYREKRRVPCSHGCGRLVLHETRHGGPPSCHACATKKAAA